MKILKLIQKKLEQKGILAIMIVIIVLASTLRFWNYLDRVSIIGDNSRDAIVGKYSSINLSPPQIGQFSSAGPFFYAPWYYWYLALTSSLPFGVLTAWYVNTLVNILLVVLIFYLGKELAGSLVGVIAAYYSSISPLLISNSISIWNVSSVPILVLIVMLLFVKFVKTRKSIYILPLSFVLLLSWSIHFQNILVLPYLALALLFVKSKRQFIICLFLAFAGAFFALLPLILFDLRFGWYDFRSILIYLLIDQSRIWYPNRWLTYIFEYWPEAWRLIVGGNKIVVYFIFIILFLALSKRIRDLRVNKALLGFVLVFALEIILFRYYRGVRHTYLSLFAAPAVIVLSAIATHHVFYYKRIIGLVLLLVISAFTLIEARKSMAEQTLTYSHVRVFINQIYKELPDKKINLYSCSIEGNSFGYPVSLFMYWDAKTSIAGESIGVCGGADGPGDLSWINLSGQDPKPPFWYRKNASDVYIDTVEWWKDNPPKPQSGSFFKFLKKQLNPRCYPNC